MSARRAWPAVAAASRLTASGANALASALPPVRRGSPLARSLGRGPSRTTAPARREVKMNRSGLATSGATIYNNESMAAPLAGPGGISMKWIMRSTSAPTDTTAAREALQSRSDFARSCGGWRPSGAQDRGI